MIEYKKDFEWKECYEKQKRTKLALIIAIIGTFFTALGDVTFGLDFGVVLIIIADIFWGLYTMTYMKINQKVSAMKVNRDLGIVAIIIYTIILLITNNKNSKEGRSIDSIIRNDSRFNSITFMSIFWIWISNIYKCIYYAWNINNILYNICDTNNYKYCFYKNMIGKMCNFFKKNLNNE